MLLNEICYKKSSIQQMIIRLDFLKFESSEIIFNDAVLKAIVDSFPQKGKQQIIKYNNLSIVDGINGTKANKSTVEGIQQDFSNYDNNKIIISNTFVILEINQYTSFEDTISVFEPVLHALFMNTHLTIIRTGIRYINTFDNNSFKPQKSFFSKDIAFVLDYKNVQSNKMQYLRSMNLIEYRVGDMRLNFRYGLFNPIYPEPIRDNSLVLDYDCYCDEAINDITNIMKHINNGHDSIQLLYENSITDKLRDLMR